MKTRNRISATRTAATAFVLTALFMLTAVASFACDNDKNVRVKIVKIVDGDTTTIEKTMDQASVKDFTKQFENIKGKNVQVMITIEDTDKDRHSKHKKECSAMNFKFDMDSSSAHSFAKAFAFSDSAMARAFVWNDSMMKNLPKNFDFNFDFDNDGEMNNFNFDINTDDKGKTVIIKNKGGKTIVINSDENGEDDNVSVSESDNDNGKTRTKTKTIIVNDDKNNKKKKVIVSTSVTVIDMNDEGSTKKKRTEKEESPVNFYPNPSDGNFILDLNLKEKEDAFVRITDMAGKEIYSEKISGSGKTSKTVNLGNDKKGTFIVTVKQGKRTTSKKIIIE